MHELLSDLLITMAMAIVLSTFVLDQNTDVRFELFTV